MLVLDQKDGSLESKFYLEEKDGAFLARKTWSDTWLILTDDILQTEDDVRNEFVPLGTFFKNGFLKSLNPKQIATVRHPQTGALCSLFEVDLEYDSKFDSQNDDNPAQVDPDDPTKMRPKRRIYTKKEDQVLERDAISGVAIRNRNGERLIVTHPVSVQVLEISRYEEYPEDFSLINFRILSYENFCNDDFFYDAPPGCACMAEINAEEEVITNSQNQKRLWLYMTYSIEMKRKLYNDEDPTAVLDGFKINVLHEGYLARPKADAKPEVYLDPKSKQPTRVNLDEKGLVLAEGADPFYLEFNRFPRTSFDPLQLQF